MSLNNPNESDDSLLDLSKLSKESKKRKIRKKTKELAPKPLQTTPTIFKIDLQEFNIFKSKVFIYIRCYMPLYLTFPTRY